MMRLVTPRGTFEFLGNELTLAGRDDDPPKLRQGAPSGAFGCLSGNRVAVDQHGAVTGQIEKCLLIMQPDDEAGGDAGCFTFYAQRPNTSDDENMLPILRLTSREAIFYVPVRYAVGEPPDPAPPSPWPPPASDPTHGIPEGAWDTIVAIYGFPSDDQEHYREGRVTWAKVIEHMDERDDWAHYPRP